MLGVIEQLLQLGEHDAAVRTRLARWSEVNFARRLWEKDSTLWFEQDQPELTDRLGWLELPESMRAQVPSLESFASEVRSEGMQHVVILGMGGSSLAPEVFGGTFTNLSRYPELIVLDSTHPDAVRAVEHRIDPTATLFVASSKSGTTLETIAFLRYFWQLVEKQDADPGRHFVAITDPETPLAVLARGRGFRRVFTAPVDVGGRYSALTVFGLVPAALMGVEIHKLLDQAHNTMALVRSGVVEANPALALGAAMGELARAHRDKATFLVSPSLGAYPIWVEQLIAESIGKDNIGIVPVVDEPPGLVDAYGDDRFFIHLSCSDEQSDDAIQLDLVTALVAAGHPVASIQLTDTLALGAEMYRTEVSVAAASTTLGINPFNQPDVQASKDITNQLMSRVGGSDASGIVSVRVGDLGTLQHALRDLIQSVQTGEYVGIQAYLEPTDETKSDLQGLQGILRMQTRAATTVGYGPRLLHSTGQLHKGGANNGVFLQLLDEPSEDLAVPGTDFTFGSCIRAQADGDYHALRQRRRRVVRVQLGSDVRGGLAALIDSVRS